MRRELEGKRVEKGVGGKKGRKGSWSREGLRRKLEGRRVKKGGETFRKRLCLNIIKLKII